MRLPVPDQADQLVPGQYQVALYSDVTKATGHGTVHIDKLTPTVTLLPALRYSGGKFIAYARLEYNGEPFISTPLKLLVDGIQVTPKQGPPWPGYRVELRASGPVSSNTKSTVHALYPGSALYNEVKVSRTYDVRVGTASAMSIVKAARAPDGWVSEFAYKVTFKVTLRTTGAAIPKPVVNAGIRIYACQNHGDPEENCNTMVASGATDSSGTLTVSTPAGYNWGPFVDYQKDVHFTAMFDGDSQRAPAIAQGKF